MNRPDGIVRGSWLRNCPERAQSRAATGLLRVVAGSAWALILTTSSALAQECPPGNPLVAPDARYVASEPDGTNFPNQWVVEDLRTGLIWKRCSEGQTGADCAGGTRSLTSWSGALGLANASNWAGFDDWRLPNIMELRTLVETGCHGPAINLSVFPATPLDNYWSSTTSNPFAALAWRLLSDLGVSNRWLKVDPTSAVRLVRGGNTFALSADLSITKTDGVATAVPGESVTYTIAVSNAGPDSIIGATVTDNFPASLSCTWTCAGAGGGTCTTGPSAGNILDSVDLPLGGSVTYTANCSVDATATGTLENTATVGSPITDPNPADNSATDTDTLTPQADLSITKTDGVTSVTAGGNTTYTITASNAGPSAAPGSTITDIFPASLTCSTSCVGAGGATCSAGPIAGNLNDLADLPVGGSVTYTAACAVDAGASGNIVNTATVAAPGGVTDPTPANNSASDTDLVATEADLAVTLTDAPDPVLPAGTLVYSAMVSNAGPSLADAVTLSLPLPANTTFESLLASTGATCSTPAVGATGTVDCTWAGGTAIADTRTLDLSVHVSASALGSLSATATAGSATTDPVLGNNSATAVTAVGIGFADLAVTLAAVPANVALGGGVTLTAEASNAGPSDAQDVQVAIVLPANLGFASVTPGAGGICTTPAVGESGTVTCTYSGATAPGVNRIVVVSASALTLGTAQITASVVGTTIDPTPENAQASATVLVVLPPSPVPSLGHGALLLLMLGFGLFGWRALRYRQ